MTGMAAAPKSPAFLAVWGFEQGQVVKADYDKWIKIIKDAGIHLD